MSSWRGVPDFSQPLNLSAAAAPGAEPAGWRLYPAADEANLFVALPNQLELAPRQPGAAAPDFSIEAVRGANPFRPPAPYGVLSFRLRPAHFPAEALEMLRQGRPGAAVTPALFTQGWLRLQLLTAGGNAADVEAAAGFGTPVPLASNGLETARCIRRLDQAQLSLLKRVLQEETLTFSAQAHLEVWGLAPRLPVRLDFAPAALLAALRPLADAQGCLTRAALLDFWIARLAVPDPAAAQPPITFLDAANAAAPAVTTVTSTTQAGDTTRVTTVLTASGGFGAAAADAARLAQVLADWTAADYTEMSAPIPPAGPACRLLQPADLPALVRWDLNQEKLIPQVLPLEFNPFLAARQAVAAGGLAAVLTETIVPVLETGVVALTVAANLPDNLQGVLHLGVDLLAPAHPPQRPQALTAALLFDNPQAVQSVRWRFSPAESVRFQAAAFALVRLPQAGGGTVIRRLNGRPSQQADDYLLLSSADFPLGFVPVKAAELLLAEARVRGVCSYADPASGAVLEQGFELSAAQPQVTLCLPVEALPQARLRLEAQALVQNGAARPQVLPLGEFPARGLRVDVTHLREYGPHSVPLEVAFDTPAAVAVLELLPESLRAQPEQAAVLAFTPAQAERLWHYFAASPFRAGYLYRAHRPPEQPPAEWSAVRSPFEALKLKTSQLG